MKRTIKTRKIIIKKNNRSQVASKLNWISASTDTTKKTSLIYISFKTGRIYFSVDNGKVPKMIKKIKFDDSKQSFKFTYKGIWESFDSNQDKEVNDDYEILFDSKAEYKKFKDIYNHD